MASIVFDHVEKRYSDGYPAVRCLDLEIRDEEFLVLVGPSGCGKSTALRLIAGLEEMSGGKLFIGGKLANDLAPRERDIAMVFQSYALYPHMTVAENMGFGLSTRGVSRADIEAKVQKTATLLELDQLLHRKPGQLSGGQRQRVAMGRALVREPNAFLMDEPLSNLDARLRGQMRGEIARLQKLSGVTTVYVTHDQIEAMTMGDRVAVMRGGVLQQLGPPRELYDKPANMFVAGFIGTPAMNLIKMKIQQVDDKLVALAGSFMLPISEQLQKTFSALCPHDGTDVVIGVRPEALSPVEGAAAASDGVLSGTVAFVEDFGAIQLVHLETAAASQLEEVIAEKDEARTAPNRLRVCLNAARRIETGSHLTLKVDPAQLHIFDPQTGRSLRV